MTAQISTGTPGKNTSGTESPNSSIRSVKQIGKCECGQPRVLVTFYNGTQLAVHDDGSFWRWTGGLNTDEHHEPLPTIGQRNV